MVRAGFRNSPIEMHTSRGEHLHMRHRLLPIAKCMRHTSTDAETRLWRYLRATRFRGFKFRRQQPLGDYIVDFVCFERKLIVEADGSQHIEHAVPDDARTAWLESQGFTVVRFWNDVVLSETNRVLDEILRILESRR